MNTGSLLPAAKKRLFAAFAHKKVQKPGPDAEPALRAELFNAEQMKAHGAELASIHRLRRQPEPDRLLPRLESNAEALADCCKTFSAAAARSEPLHHLSPAAEWLLDNYWLIEEQIHTVRKHLPRGYSKELPQLAEGPSAGFPRVYDIALENISHGDGRLDSETLRVFVGAYQTVAPLSLGELWAVPIMLRLALIENLRRVAYRVLTAWQDQQTALLWAERLTEAAGKDRKSVVLAIADMATANPPMTSAFVAELTRRLQGQGATFAHPLGWIEDLLSEKGLTIDRLVQWDTQQQAADQVSVSNSITSLRLLASVDWQEFVENLSLVEKILRGDPAGVYPRMDFATRDHYRHVIESMAKKHGVAESEVAQAAIRLADDNAPSGAYQAEDAKAEFSGQPAMHVGYYLSGAGLPLLQRAVGKKGIAGKVRQTCSHVLHLREKISLSTYLGLTFVLTCLLAWPFAAAMHNKGHSAFAAALAVLGLLFVGSQAALGIMNLLVAMLLPARPMPRMDYRDGIPDRARTLVVIPTMIGSAQEVESLLERLEVHFLANRDKNIQFGLLTDFKDSRMETEPGDGDLLKAATRGIDALNEKYASGRVDSFFLCHRPRRWNEKEQSWIAFERKRGKLCEFNQLLHGSGRDRFLLIRGNTLDRQERDGNVRYVITLDTDTQLPRDAARKLVACMAHPLNQAVYDPARQCVVSGYGIIQPRVAITLPSANRSLYSRLFCFDAGVDPYTRSVSDLYQDLFRQGSYTGKGIYDLATFEQAVGGRFPENTILSHDLIEGCYARSGLASDILLYEEFPSCYSAEVKRRHRWIRGDWQILPWLFPFVRNASGTLEKNPLSALSRWKILDNLRRSLVPPALLLLFVCGWLGFASPWLWTVCLLALVLALPLLHSLTATARKPRDMTWKLHLTASARNLGRSCLETLLYLAWLPYEAYYCLDAVVRTLWRIGVSRRRFLQWNPSVDVERTSVKSFPGLYRLMAVCPILVLVLGIALYPAHRLPPALPLLGLWLVSPALAWLLSKPRKRKRFTPDEQQERFLRALARRTWAFFQTYVNQENNWLPPDNFQEKPFPVVAHRTSPTNIGIALLSHVAAHKFGYISARGLLERLRSTFETLSRLERHRGHFYNWYDTRTLEPLMPQYVSTVDSGNFAGHLMVLRQALLSLIHGPLFTRRIFKGLADISMIISDSFPALAKTGAWRAFVKELRAVLEARYESPEQILDSSRRLLVLAEEACSAMKPQADSEALFWLDALQQQVEDLCGEIGAFVPPSAAGGKAAQQPLTLFSLSRIDPASYPEADRAKAMEIRDAAARLAALAEELAETAGEMARMDFTFLFDHSRDLLSIGYNVADRRLDSSYYDLLASEARLTYFLAIALGQLPQSSWFALGRMLTGDPGSPVLLSWSGSMFEYLMPLLVMPGYEGTLLDETCRGAVEMQIRYGKKLNLPWGVSESGYNIRDGQYNYQYRAFGVPGLGLDRGLADNVVLAPYASAMALMVKPQAACRNLQRLNKLGLGGRYGMYEAVDFTAVRLPRGQSFAVVYSFMAHHQGMSFLSLASLLLGNPMQRLFLAEPAFQATKLLLEERMPEIATEMLHARDLPHQNTGEKARAEERTLRIIKSPDTSPPAVQLLSNGRYHLMISSAGGGYSRHGDLALTRWREDSTRDNWGSFCYLREMSTGEYWSATYQPVCRKTDRYEAIFTDARAEFKVRQNEFDSHTEIAVSPENDVELRRIRVFNRSRERRTIELTSYAEIVIAPQMADEQHPAFSNLFVQTEIVEPLQAVLSTRRPRSANERRVFHFQLLAAHGADLDAISYETSRSRFIGRGRTLANPEALDFSPDRERLSGTSGAVLDPIVSIRCHVTLEGGQSATIDLVSGIAETRDGCLTLIEKFRDKQLADRVFSLAWTHSQVLLHQFNATLFDAHLYEQMAASILYPSRAMRASADLIKANTRGQSGLWGQSISGDLPIVLVKITDTANVDLVTQMVKAHAYWRMKGLTTDLIIWNEDHFSYRQYLNDLIVSVIPAGLEGNVMDRPGGIFVRAAQQLSREDRILIQAAPRLVIRDTAGPLEEQILQRRAAPRLPGYCPYVPGQDAKGRKGHFRNMARTEESAGDGLILANQFGGFTQDGSEYVITLRNGETTPAPWVNVLANAGFGSIVTESGGAYTWKENAHEFRLTPWYNDPVSDASGEALYIRDEATGRFWSPTPLPVRGPGPYVIRHGFGYSTFIHRNEGIRSTLEVFVAKDDPVKISRLRLENQSGENRSLSVTGYVEWVLADLRSKSALHVITKTDPVSGLILARNSYTMDFPGRIAFFESNLQQRTISGDRTEFLGRNGSTAMPLAMKRTCLSGRIGAGFDPCGAIQGAVDLREGESVEILFVLGAADSIDEAFRLARKFSDLTTAAEELKAVKEVWKERLGAVRVQTPDEAVNVMANGWLLYQSMASRYLGRSGYYQSGGAFGFRDQLQDTMAMLYAEPGLARSHLLLSAAHQFPEGDVQHWWHPPLDRGVRTRCSDDYLWLPLAVERYISVTGDRSILDEEAGYIDMRHLNPEEESFYDLPMISTLRETVYQHCVRAIRNGLKFGSHGLPLMGSGDWNDGMDRVGIEGKGESVWLGFFLHMVLTRFAPLAASKDDTEFAELCRREAESLEYNLNANAWDGDWFRRAYMDDGRPLGSTQSSECRIDSIAQSWSVLSGAASEERQRRAMDALYANLVQPDIGIVQLLTPPFDQSDLDPGYIKGYVPGVRENGGQYTHAAVWAAMAFAELGDGQKAWALADMINPVRHGDSPEAVRIYKAEPYVIAADVYGVPPHEGRGGWSWYTGAAGWMYRLILESLLGLQVTDGTMRLAPLLPEGWTEASLRFRHKSAAYNVTLKKTDGVTGTAASLDGQQVKDGAIPLADDGREHTVEVRLPG